MSTLTETRANTTTRVALAISVLALLLSGWSLVESMTDELDQGQIEQRLQCLELPGPNDCGPGR
jgi:hypothetical protein